MKALRLIWRDAVKEISFNSGRNSIYMNFLLNRLSQKQALNCMIALLAAVIVFHVLVLVQVIPYTIVWAGKINSVEEMVTMETVSIAINVILILVLLLKGNYIKNKISTKTLNAIIWLFVIVFALNTVGNLFSKTTLELYLFTTLTFISALLCLRIVVEKKGS
jgi:hypothetical protein